VQFVAEFHASRVLCDGCATRRMLY
jgi:hypothetical protein